MLNTSTPNQTQETTVSEITASPDFRDCTSWKTIPPTHQIIYCYSPRSVYITRPKQLHLTSLKQKQIIKIQLDII